MKLIQHDLNEDAHNAYGAKLRLNNFDIEI
jgi:hypothetical protein